jgi:hypothetical protein
MSFGSRKGLKEDKDIYFFNVCNLERHFFPLVFFATPFLVEFKDDL